MQRLLSTLLDTYPGAVLGETSALFGEEGGGEATRTAECAAQEAT